MVRRLLTALVVLALLALCGTAMLAQHQTASVPWSPTSGEAFLWSLSAEQLSNVAEGKMEAIASYQSRIRQLEADLDRVQEIQAEKMAAASPPPE